MEVNIIPITTYSLIHFIGYFILFSLNIRPAVYTTILKNNFLVVIYVIVTLVVYQYLVGNILKGIAVLFSYFANKTRDYRIMRRGRRTIAST
jgi:hypothetical protein